VVDSLLLKIGTMDRVCKGEKQLFLVKILTLFTWMVGSSQAALRAVKRRKTGLARTLEA
jgi:hypothetical protein